MSDNTTDFFDNIGGGAGAPTAHLKVTGDYVHGEVVEMFKRDYIPFGKTDAEADENEPDGKRKQLVIILQTENRNWAGVVRVPKVDPADSNSAEKSPSEDDGKRAIYVPNRSNIQYAVGRAVQASKAKFEVGGSLGVKIVNLKDTGKGNPLKEHEAVYKAKPAATGDEFFGGGQQAAPAAAPLPQGSSFGGGDQANAPATPPPAAQQAPAAQQDPWATSSAPATSEPPF